MSKAEGRDKEGRVKREKKSAPPAEAAAPPVYSMPHDEQVDLLAQALLREYMHRKGFKATLETFDRENPRDDRTISSRAVMTDLMVLPPERQAVLKEAGAATIMEMLCRSRLPKAAALQRMGALQAVSQQELPALPEAPVSHDSDEGGEGPAPAGAGEKAKKKKDKKAKKEKKAKREKAGGEIKKPKKKEMTIDDLLNMDTPVVSRKTSKVQLDSAVPTGDRRDDSSRDAAAKTRDQEEGDESDGANSTSGSSSASGDDFSASLRRLREEEEQSLRHRHMQRDASAGVHGTRAGWILDTASDEPSATLGRHSSDLTATTPRPSKTPSPGASPARARNALGDEAAADIFQALVGSGSQAAFRRIPGSFMAQGFYFNHAPEALRYGMVQNEGGPCGVLATIQALVLARFGTNHFIVTADVQRSFLASALAEALLIAQPDLTRVRVVAVVPEVAMPWSGGTADDQRRFIASQLGTIGANFSSRKDVEDCIRGVLGNVDGQHRTSLGAADWCAPRGFGLLSFLCSVVVSVGRGPLAAAMDVEGPLIVDHGYCAQELVNLLISGHATSNLHDGRKSAGSLELKGILAPSVPVGVLSFAETQGYLEVGGICKEPAAAAWIILHESHYTALFLKADDRQKIRARYQSESSTSFDVFYYDPLGRQDEEVRLTIRLDELPIPAVPATALVPYLNPILRTVPGWHLAKVNWNGMDPLL